MSTSTPARKKFVIGKRGTSRKAWKVGIYSPEGAGKSTLASLCPNAVFADIEHSTMDLPVQRVEGIECWADLRAWVQSLDGSDGTVAVIDSMTRAEDWCVEHVIKNKKSNEGVKATDSIEDFKYRAGLVFVTEEFKRFLGDIESAFLRGQSFIMIAHNRITRFRNPDGSDYVRNQPRLLHEEKGSNMEPWVQSLDHLLYIDMDAAVSKGKAVGSGSRTLYAAGTPNRVAKSRTIAVPSFALNRGDDRVWKMIAGESADVPPADDVPPM